MKIIKLSNAAHDLEVVYDGLKEALKELNRNHIGKTKNEIKKAIKELEKIRPDLKNIEKMEAYYKYKGWRK